MGVLLFLPIIALSLALIVFGVPYCFISDIKDLRVRWAVAGAYAGLLLGLTLVVDVTHFYEMFSAFSITKAFEVLSCTALGALGGWTLGAWVNSGRKALK